MLHVTAVVDPLVTVAVNCCVSPAVRLAVVGLIVTVTVGVALRVMRAVPLTLESASLVAVTVIVVAEVTVAGAVYTPFPSMLPVCGLMLQMYPEPPPVAVNCAVPAGLSEIVAGVTVMEGGFS
jgi:hypothetical protein